MKRKPCTFETLIVISKKYQIMSILYLINITYKNFERLSEKIINVPNFLDNLPHLIQQTRLQHSRIKK